METNLNLVAFHDKELITTSSIVAKVFGKRHADVLRSIEDIVSQLDALWLVEHERIGAFMFNPEHENMGIDERPVRPDGLAECLIQYGGALLQAVRQVARAARSWRGRGAVQRQRPEPVHDLPVHVT